MAGLEGVILVEEDAVCFTQETACPRRWSALETTTQQHVRVCRTCGREVHYCESKAEALSHCQRMEAVAAPLFQGEPQGKPRYAA